MDNVRSVHPTTSLVKDIVSLVQSTQWLTVGAISVTAQVDSLLTSSEFVPENVELIKFLTQLHINVNA